MARILSVSDAFDAMLSPRPHRPALSTSRVDAVLTEGASSTGTPASSISSSPIARACTPCVRSPPEFKPRRP